MPTRPHSKVCAHCDYPLAEEQSRCPECGLYWVEPPVPVNVKECRQCAALLARDENMCSKCGTEWSAVLRKPPDVQFLQAHIECAATRSSCALKQVFPVWQRAVFLLGSTCAWSVGLYFGAASVKPPIPTRVDVLIGVGFVISWAIMALAELVHWHTPLRANADAIKYGTKHYQRVPGERITLRMTPPVAVLGDGEGAPHQAPLIMLVHSTHGDLCPLYRPLGIRRSDLIAIGKLNEFLDRTLPSAPPH